MDWFLNSEFELTPWITKPPHRLTPTKKKKNLNKSLFCIHKKDVWYDIYSFLKNYDMMIKILTENFNDI